jgi:c(7)-type cytochrome triheme protein
LRRALAIALLLVPAALAIALAADAPPAAPTPTDAAPAADAGPAAPDAGARVRIAAPLPPRDTPTAPPAAVHVTGFDHLTHDGHVGVLVEHPPACLDCHALDQRGAPRTPGHAACFAAGCHTLPPPARPKSPPPDEATARVCLACHDTPRPGKRAPVADPGVATRDFGVLFPHDRHAAGDGAAPCERCHDVPADPVARPAAAKPAATKPPAATPHPRCVGCHTATQTTPFPLTACERCHDALGGKFVAPHLLQGAYSVRARFSHARHLTGPVRSQPAGRCLPCHEAIAHTASRDLPAPAMTDCETCHDGKAAFPALQPTCTRCHVKGDALPSAAPPKRYDHASHAKLAVGDCATCHTLAAGGAPRPASADHMPCARAECHAAEFRAPEPTICGGCHVGTEPWRKLHADAPRRTVSEFGVELSHASHLGGDHPRSPQGCSDCHTGLTAGPEMRLGPGHATCAGAACHQLAAGPAPRLDACASCHTLGLLPGRDQRRAHSRWSVAPRFDHAPHRAERGGQPLPCSDCHEGVLAAATVAAIAPPKKAACAGCHDGVQAFKMTGHQCARCHTHE